MSEEHLKQLEKISEEDADDSQINPDENVDEDSDDGSMSLTNHLEELRSRIIKCLISVGICSCFTFSFVEEIMHYISKPAGK